MVRAPLAPDEQLITAARSSGVALLTLARGASWAQLMAMIRSLITEGSSDEADGDTFGGVPSGDLFAVANAISSLLDAPITIEDRTSRVLAFSGRQDEADPSRVQSILGRQVPERYTRILEERGVFQEMYRSDQPIFVAPLPDTGDTFELPRVAIAVRAGDEILGAIWVAALEPLNDERNQALCDASKLVAMHMVWQRADADVERRLRADLLDAALEGGSGSAEAIRRLGLKDEPAVVLALTLVGSSAEHAMHAQLAAERKRLADAFAMHLSAVHPRAVAGLIGDVAYGILPVLRNQRDAEDRALRIAVEFLGRVGPRLRPLVGVGPIAADSSGLAGSRSGADRALRVLRSGYASQQVARIADVHVEALLLELADLVPRGDPPAGPVARLAAYDAQHRSALVDTLRAWLDNFGDVAAASASMYVHVNTFRYRLRRVAQVGRIDLADSNERFGAMLQLRLMSIKSMPDGK